MVRVSLKDIMKKKELNAEIMIEIEMKRFYNSSVYARDFKITTKNVFVAINNGEQGGTYRTFLYTEDNKSYLFDSFRGYLDKFSIKQLRTPINFHIFKLQDKNSKLCGTYIAYTFSM